MQSILIIGANGMLGQELVRAYSNDTAYTVTAWDKDDIDITNKQEVVEKIGTLWPDVIFNAAAYNAVDLCEESEEEYQKALELNGNAPGYLAAVAKDLQAVLVHYSTDYVFDGQRPEHCKRQPEGCCGSGCDGCMYYGPEESLSYYEYSEDDIPKPLSKYGKTKYDGEQNVAKYTNDYFIIRLSKLFGSPGGSDQAKRSFFDIMKELGEKNGSVKAVDGEISKFTYAPDLAQESKKLVDASLNGESSSEAEFGIYHFVNETAVTWCDGAKKLFELLGTDVTVTPVPPSEFPRPAPRPSSSSLLNTKWTPLRSYEDALREYVETVLTSSKN